MSTSDFQLRLSSLERGKCRGGMVYMLDILYVLKIKLPGRRKTTEKVRGCSKGGHEDGWHRRRGVKGEMQMTRCGDSYRELLKA